MFHHLLSKVVFLFSMVLNLDGLSAQPGIVSNEIVPLKWINFGPYTKPGQSPGTGILPESQIIALLDSLLPYVEGIRTYGTQGGVEKIPRLAKERGLSVMVGIYLSADTLVNNIQMANAIAIAHAGYADKIIVGGEVLYNQLLTPSQLIAYINQVKAACPTIPVSSADVYSALIQYPEVAGACDFIFPNIYPYYEGQPVECALQRFDQTYQSILHVAAGKEIIISETGWKTSGPPVGDAKPSYTNAIRYHRELLAWSKAKGVVVTLFSAFDEPWKLPFNDDGWGIFYSDATLKPGMDSVFLPLLHIDSTWLCKAPPLAGSDTLVLDYIPVIGSFDDIKGHINYLNPCEINIATYIKVGQGWWTKPTFASPAVPILCNGKWKVDFTAGGNDQLATDMCFFAIPSGYIPPSCSGCGSIPQELFTNAISSTCIQRYNLTSASVVALKGKICAGDTTTLTASGGTQFLWSTGETTSTVEVNPISTTTYSVTITDGSGGGAIKSVKVTVASNPTFSIAVSPDTIPTGGTATLTINGGAGITYQWNTGETTTIIQVAPITTTTYSVTGTNADGCQTTVSVNVVVNPLVSTSNIKSIRSITIYPKPTNGRFQAELKMNSTKPVTCSIINSIGCIIARRVEHPDYGELILQFDISSFPAGTYFLLLHVENSETWIEKIPVYMH